MTDGVPTNVPTRGLAIWVACVVAPIISGIFVLLRAYTRIFITKKVFLSDWVSFVTLIWICAFSGTLAQATYNGMGRHSSDLDPQMESAMYFWILVSSEFYVLSLAGYKSALLLLYLQIFGVNRKFRYVCYGVLAYTIGYLFCNLIVEVGGCHPIQKFWLPDTPGHCTNSVAQDIAFGVGHMTSDLLIAILPLPMVWRLHLRSTREKIGLAFVLGTGLIAWVVACVRFVYAAIDLTSSDRTWIAGVTFFLSVLEVNTGLICGCTPALKPLITNVKENSRNWSRKRSTAHESGQNGSKGFLELKAVDATSSHRKGSTPGEDAGRRPTYTDGQIAYAYPKGAKVNEDVLSASTQDTDSTKRMTVPRLTSDELFEGTTLHPHHDQGIEDLERGARAPVRDPKDLV